MGPVTQEFSDGESVSDQTVTGQLDGESSFPEFLDVTTYLYKRVCPYVSLSCLSELSYFVVLSDHTSKKPWMRGAAPNLASSYFCVSGLVCIPTGADEFA